MPFPLAFRPEVRAQLTRELNLGMDPWTPEISITVLLPHCGGDDPIADIVGGFREALPAAQILVYVAAGDDATAARAIASGAIVRRGTLRTRGEILQRLFADIDADVYILADAQSDAGAAPSLVARLVADRLDLVTGVSQGEASTWDDRLAEAALGALFGRACEGFCSGYRVLSRRFVKSLPGLSGSEVEAELTAHALQLQLPMVEMSTRSRQVAEPAAGPRFYAARLHKLVDVARRFKQARPLLLFGLIAWLSAILAACVAGPLFVAHPQPIMAPDLARATMAIALLVAGGVSLSCGIVLDSIGRARIEARRMYYLAIAARRAD